MCRKIPLAMLGLMATLAIGCDKQEATPPPPPTGTVDPVASDATKQMNQAVDDVKTQVETAGGEVKETVDAATDQVAQVKDDAADKVEAAKTEAAEVAENATAEAQTLVDQAMGYIKENKLDLAEKTLAKLDTMKGSLPESMQSQIANAQKALDAAKAMDSGNPADALGGIKLPGK